MNKPDIKLNPHPKMRYEITMTVEGAPGPFEKIEGHVDYHVSNPNSVPLTPFSGATVEPQADAPLTFEHVGGNVYKAFFYADRFLDEDYFGQGVCRWSLVGVTGNLIHEPITFSPSIFKDDVFSGRAVTRWFANDSYEDGSMRRIDIGASSAKEYKKPDDVFSVTLQTVEKVP
ncbi:hypothetical protein [Luteibacter sp. UNC138MFCol5.1]|uniref:hypothetical protein n=1 Tax=Luteibacter sp. UNC138MFCol5.1 TaxID=1502774 RepID=UPI000B7D1438|nr:hypothetical protein [Luteibacter sp. UNC138MFCol5.1]